MLLNNYILFVEAKTYGLDDETIHKIRSADPHPNKAYSGWMSRMVRSGDISTDNLSDVSKHLNLFKNNSQKIDKTKRDINSYKTFQDLKNVTSSFDKESEDPNKIQFHQEFPEDLSQYGKIHFQNKDFTVIRPHNYQCSQKLGSIGDIENPNRAVSWCTVRSGAWHYDTENAHNDPKGHGLYYILPHKDPSNKHAISFQQNQSQNPANERIHRGEMISRFPALKNGNVKAFDESTHENSIPYKSPEKISKYVDDYISGNIGLDNTNKENIEAIARTTDQKNILDKLLSNKVSFEHLIKNPNLDNSHFDKLYNEGDEDTKFEVAKHSPNPIHAMSFIQTPTTNDNAFKKADIGKNTKSPSILAELGKQDHPLINNAISSNKLLPENTSEHILNRNIRGKDINVGSIEEDTLVNLLQNQSKRKRENIYDEFENHPLDKVKQTILSNTNNQDRILRMLDNNTSHFDLDAPNHVFKKDESYAQAAISNPNITNTTISDALGNTFGINPKTGNKFSKKNSEVTATLIGKSNDERLFDMMENHPSLNIRKAIVSRTRDTDRLNRFINGNDLNLIEPAKNRLKLLTSRE